MTRLMTLTLAFASLMLVACGASGSGQAAQTCRSNADCASGEMCDGAEGCDAAWTCVPERACSTDLAEYCGCDGRTVRGSGSCPPAPFSRRGACE